MFECAGIFEDVGRIVDAVLENMAGGCYGLWVVIWNDKKCLSEKNFSYAETHKLVFRQAFVLST